MAWEDNRDVSGAAAGECGVSNTSDLVRVCGQSFAVDEQNYVMDGDWTVKFFVDQATDLDISTAIAEWDGYQLAKESASRNWTTCDGGDCGAVQTASFPNADPTYDPPSDTVGNVTMRRLMVKFEYNSGAGTTISYDNSGVDSRLEAGGSAGTQDAIDTVPANIKDNMSSVADASNNVHLLYISDEGTDQVRYKKRTGTTWDASPTLVANLADNDDAYVTLSYQTSNNELYALWIDSGDTDDIFWAYCSNGSGCNSGPGDWNPENTWKTADTYTYTTSNYSGVPIFAMWTVGDAAPYHVSWDIVVIPEKLWLFFGVAPLIPLLIRWKRRKKYAYLEQQQPQTIRRAIYQDQSFWERHTVDPGG